MSISQKPDSKDPALNGNPTVEGKCRELIACLIKVGGYVELQTALHTHMPDQVKCLSSAAHRKTSTRSAYAEPRVSRERMRGRGGEGGGGGLG